MYYIGSNVYNWPLEAQRGLADGRVLITLLDRELTFLLGHELCVRKSLCFSVNRMISGTDVVTRYMVSSL